MRCFKIFLQELKSGFMSRMILKSRIALFWYQGKVEMNFCFNKNRLGWLLIEKFEENFNSSQFKSKTFYMV